MMLHTCKNYKADGGDTLVIGGKLIVKPGAVVEGLGAGQKAENQPESTSTTVATLRSDLNALLAKLKAAGLMEVDPEE